MNVEPGSSGSSLLCPKAGSWVSSSPFCLRPDITQPANCQFCMALGTEEDCLASPHWMLHSQNSRVPALNRFLVYWCENMANQMHSSVVKESTSPEDRAQESCIESRPSLPLQRKPAHESQKEDTKWGLCRSN